MPEIQEDQFREALQGAARRVVERKRATDPSGHFPWHELQEWTFDAPNLFPNPLRVMLLVGGNRSGKSKLAMGHIDKILQRSSPVNEQLMTTDPVTGAIRHKDESDPIRMWIIPPTMEKFRTDWVWPTDGMGLQHFMGDRFVKMRENPDFMFIGKPPGVEEDALYDEEGGLIRSKCDILIGKSQDQKLETFESSEIDVAVFDEEPTNRKIVTSTMMRVATSNGVLIFSYTPLHGLSWSYDLWWKPLIKQSRAVQVGERRWIHAPGDPEMGGKVIVQMGMADNPRAAAYAKEILADPTRTEAEKAARVYGEYGYVEGALIEKLAGIDLVNPNPEHKQYVVHELPEDPHIVDWYLVADPNKSYGALLGCLDSDGNLFFVAEHLKEGWPNRLHAEKFKQMEYNFATGPVQRYADPGSAGAQAIIDLEDFGLYFDTVEKGAGSVSRSIKRLRGMAWEDPDHFHPITGEKGAPRIYFYAPGLVSSHEEEGLQVVGSQLAEQISNARQKEDAAPDTPDKDSQNRLDLWDCARYMADIVMVRGPVETDSRLVPKDRGRLPSDKDLLASQEEESYKLDAVELWTPDYSF